jgi:hypothetical protein
MEIVKTFSLIKVAICTQFLDIVPSMCGFKYLRRRYLSVWCGRSSLAKRDSATVLLCGRLVDKLPEETFRPRTFYCLTK